MSFSGLIRLGLGSRPLVCHPCGGLAIHPECFPAYGPRLWDRLQLSLRFYSEKWFGKWMDGSEPFLPLQKGT